MIKKLLFAYLFFHSILMFSQSNSYFNNQFNIKFENSSPFFVDEQKLESYQVTILNIKSVSKKFNIEVSIYNTTEEKKKFYKEEINSFKVRLKNLSVIVNEYNKDVFYSINNDEPYSEFWIVFYNNKNTIWISGKWDNNFNETKEQNIKSLINSFKY